MKKGMKKEPNLTNENQRNISLKELQITSQQNQELYQQVIKDFNKEISQMNLNRGRVRPKHPDEQRILSSFKRK